MRLEAERTSEREATPELIRKLVHDASARGEFMILMDDNDDERYVQIACDYDDVGGRDDGCFDLEYRSGSTSRLLHCKRRVTAEEVERLFLAEFVGDTSWRDDFSWDDLEWPASSKGFRVEKVVKPLIGVGLLAALLWQVVKIIRQGVSNVGELLPLVILGILAFAFLGPFWRSLVHCLRHKNSTVKEFEPIPLEGIRLTRKWPENIVNEFIVTIVWNGFAWSAFIFGALPKIREEGVSFEVLGFAVFPLIGSVLFILFARMIRDHLRPHYEICLVGNRPGANGSATLAYRLVGSPDTVKEAWFELITRSREGLFVSPGYTYGSTTWWTLRNPADISSGTRTHRMPAVDPNFQGEIDYTLQVLVKFQDGRFYFSYYPIPT